MALDILMKGPSLDWTEDNQLYNLLQGLEEEGRDVDDWHGTEERTPRIHLSLHKGLFRGNRPFTLRSSGGSYR